MKLDPSTLPLINAACAHVQAQGIFLFLPCEDECGPLEHIAETDRLPSRRALLLGVMPWGDACVKFCRLEPAVCAKVLT